jgi:hypothetical protein
MIDRQLIQGLINPAFGQQMSEDLRRMAERNRKQKMLKPLFEAEGMFTKAAESGDARLAAEQGAKLMQAAQQSGDTAAFKRGQEMRGQAPQIQVQGAVKGIDNIEKALKREDLPPEARAALEQRKTALLQTQGVGEVMAARRDAQVKALEQKDKVEGMQRAEAERKGMGMLVSGADEETVANTIGANAWAAIQGDWGSYKDRRKKAAEEAAAPKFSTEMLSFQELSEKGQREVLRAQEIGGKEGALTALKRVVGEEAKIQLETAQKGRDSNRIVDSETFANKLFTQSETQANWWPGTWGKAFKKDTAEWYEGQDDDQKEAIREQVVEAYKLARWEFEEGGAEGNKEEHIAKKVETVLRSFGAPVPETTEVANEETDVAEGMMQAAQSRRDALLARRKALLEGSK